MLADVYLEDYDDVYHFVRVHFDHEILVFVHQKME